MTIVTVAKGGDSKLYDVIDRRNPDGSVVREVSLARLHAGQARAWYSNRRIVAVISGTQGGKTTFGPWWLWREFMRRGPGDYLAATATFDLFQLKMLPSLREVLEEVLGVARSWAGILELCQHKQNPETGLWEPMRDKAGNTIFGASRASESHKMWGRIIMRSASSEGGLESATAKAAWLDEAGQDSFGLGAWEAVLRRLSLARGRILITTTPYNLGWLKQQVYDPAMKGDTGIDLIQFASIVNPSFPEEEFNDRRDKMSDWKFRMFYMAQFERPAGLIYSDFIPRYREEGGHKVKPFQLDPYWPRYGGIDPGAVHTAKVWICHNTRADEYYLYREDLSGGKSTPEHAAEILAYADQAVTWHVGAKSESQQRMDYREAGLKNTLEPEVGDVESGIDRVVQLFREHRLFIFDTCVGILDEIGMYRREVDESDDPTDKIKDKAYYHRLDALRYVVAGITSPHHPMLRQAESKGLYSSQEVEHKDTARIEVKKRRHHALYAQSVSKRTPES